MQLNSVIVASSNIAVSEINFEALPRDATIIRCGNFYDEELYSLGAEVDYCTISEQSEALIKRLAQVAYSGAYTIKITSMQAIRIIRCRKCSADSRRSREPSTAYPP
ncbi:hypothetical protein DA101_018730 [Sinorhizobium meliloti]|nr:hypothetical protein DA101_018730 [Sinorhizobium meliloti]